MIKLIEEGMVTSNTEIYDFYQKVIFVLILEQNIFKSQLSMNYSPGVAVLNGLRYLHNNDPRCGLSDLLIFL